MRFSFKRAFEAIGHGSTVWTFLPTAWQGAVTTALTVVTGYFGYQSGGVFFALVGGTIVFACCCAAAYFVLRVARLMSVFERVSIVAVGIQDGGFSDEPNHRVTYLTMNFVLKNDSERLVFYRIRRAHNELSGKVHPGAGVDRNILILQVGASATVGLPTLKDIALPGGDVRTAPEGRLEVEIEYGPFVDDLCYLMRYVSQTGLGVVFNKETKSAQLNMAASVQELTHEKVR
jgi:hypothetical protein